jgi:hypothetical protein
MNARTSENYLSIVRSASKSVEIFWAEIYVGQLFLGPNHAHSIELSFLYWSYRSLSPCYAGKDYLPSLTLLCGINYSTCKQIGGLNN